MSEGRQQRSVRNFLLNPGFQLKYAGLIAICGGIIFGVMAWMFFDKVRENSELLSVEAVAVERAVIPAALNTDSPFEAELASRLAHEDAPMRWTLLGFCVLLVGLLFIVGIFVTHRIVGPLHVVENTIQRVIERRPVGARRLRQGDEFAPLFHRVNELVETIQVERANDADVLAKAIRAMRTHSGRLGWLEEIIEPIEEMVEAKRHNLKDA